MRVYGETLSDWPRKMTYCIDCDGCGIRLATVNVCSSPRGLGLPMEYLENFFRSRGYPVPGDDPVKEYCIDCEAKK